MWILKWQRALLDGLTGDLTVHFMHMTTRWALGVLIYEMVAGYPPFYDEDRVAMFKNICQVKYSVPSHFSKVRPS